MAGGVHEGKPIHERCKARGPRIMPRKRPHTRQAAATRKKKDNRGRQGRTYLETRADRKYSTHVFPVLSSCPTALSSGSDADVLGYEWEQE